jgi:hypothetical protein
MRIIPFSHILGQARVVLQTYSDPDNHWRLSRISLVILPYHISKFFHDDLVCRYNSHMVTYFLILGVALTHWFWLQTVPACWSGNRLTVGVVNRQGMHTSPKHLIPPLLHLEVLVGPVLWFVFHTLSWGYWLFVILLLSCMSFTFRKKKYLEILMYISTGEVTEIYLYFWESRLY